MENNIKLTKKQEALFNYLNSGKKLIQERNALFMDGEKISTRTLVSLMYKLNPKNYREDLKNSIIIK